MSSGMTYYRAILGRLDGDPDEAIRITSDAEHETVIDAEDGWKGNRGLTIGAGNPERTARMIVGGHVDAWGF